MAEPHRWTHVRKAQLVQDVAFHRLDRAQAIERHGLSEEEFGAWERTFQVHGAEGLRVGHRRPKVAGDAP